MTAAHNCTATRLFRKLCKRLCALGVGSFYHKDNLQSAALWTLLHALSKQGSVAVEAERRLRSAKFSATHIFLMRRLAANVDGPPRSQLLSVLNRVLIFKEQLPPPSHGPLVLPFLARVNLPTAVKAWIRGFIVQLKENLPPFHLLQARPVAGKLPVMSALLFSHANVTKVWKKHPFLDRVWLSGQWLPQRRR